MRSTLSASKRRKKGNGETLLSLRQTAGNRNGKENVIGTSKQKRRKEGTNERWKGRGAPVEIEKLAWWFTIVALFRELLFYYLARFFHCWIYLPPCGLLGIRESRRKIGG